MSIVDAYKDYTFIMYVICDKTASFYSKIKNIINIPIVICSTGLSILNTTEFDKDMEKIIMTRYVSICFNLLIALSVAILNLFKITEKEFLFKSHSMNFLKLHNKINAEITKCNTIMIEVDILNIINEYNILCEYITFHIPSHIRKSVQKNYPSYKFPILLIDNKKEKKKRNSLQKMKCDETNSSSSIQNIVIDDDEFHQTSQSFLDVQSPFALWAETMQNSRKTMKPSTLQ